jgi:hypothetical protein
MQIQGQVHSTFNRIVSDLDPFGYECTRPDLLVIESVRHHRDVQELLEWRKAINLIESENIRLSAELNDSLPRDSSRDSLLLPAIEPQRFEINSQQRVKISQMRGSIERQIIENDGIRQQIAALERRIDLMNRKKSYICDPGLIRARAVLIQQVV